MTEKFIPLYCKENLSLINSYGSVGVVTLWSRKEFVYKEFLEMGIDLNPHTSSIAAFGNLYGNGFKYLITNLLYNPQIYFLLVCGWNRSGSLEELQNFFNLGVEEYKSLGVNRNRIIGTNRTIDTCLYPELFSAPPEIISLGDINNRITKEKIITFFRDLPQKINNMYPKNIKRIKVNLPGLSVRYFPSNPGGHTIIKDTPLEAWKELIFRLNRFGHFVNLGSKKGERIELQNVKVIVEKPCDESEEVLNRYGFALSMFKDYQKDILKGSIRENEEAYNYGNRIRTYFNVDGLTECINKLNKDLQNRRAFIVLWDPKTDLTETERNSPCMISLFFRVFGDKLTLSATFRVHNAVTAWLENFYGLMEIQKFVSKETGLESGSIIVISHSISINTLEYDRVIPVIKEKEKRLDFETDPNGNFRISVEAGEIVVKHIYDGEVIGEYKSKKAERIQYELKRDYAISDIAHAIFIGRQLAKAERCLLTGEIFIEDK
jgi:thymidylate synthase